MTKKNSSLALPARMSVASDLPADLKIAILMFPFAKEVNDFCKDVEKVLRSKKKEYAPYRQLNNALLACTSTLTYGFEKFEVVDYINRYRALAVGTRENPLRVPTPEQIHELILIWAQTWTQYLRKKGNRDEIASVCDRFLDAVADVPANWDWESIEPQTLIQDTSAENSLGYQAIPSLLATLLHERTCTISSGDREQIIKWRKVQGGGFGKVGLYLISQFFKAIYYDDDGKEKEGYFAYRLDFYLQTQAGRFNSKGKLKPWIFLHLSCQRYAHEPLDDANFGRDISILMGMNQERLDNFPIDSTLVRLVIDNSTNKDNRYWKEQLTKLLAAFKARSLTEPPNILNNPAELENLDNISNWKDEYYLVHAEGYKYKQAQKRGKGHGHSIKTGFSLKERGDITAQVLQQLDGILIPDVPMECDIPVLFGQNTPLAMRNYNFIQKPLSFTPKKREDLGEQEIKRQQEQHCQQRKTLIDDAFKRATNGKPIHLFILWYEADTHDLIIQQLQQNFLLKENENFPEHIKVTYVHIEDANLLRKLPVDGLPSKNDNFNEQINTQHRHKRKAWQNFFKQKVIPLVDCHINPYVFCNCRNWQSQRTRQTS